MIVRRCPDCGLKYEYPHGEPDPHDCKSRRPNATDLLVSVLPKATVCPMCGQSIGKAASGWTEGKTYNDGDKVTMASGEKATARKIKPGWSEERRAAQRAKMNEWHRKQAEARAAARAATAGPNQTGTITDT